MHKGPLSPISSPTPRSPFVLICLGIALFIVGYSWPNLSFSYDLYKDDAVSVRRYTDRFQKDIASSDGRCESFLRAGPGGARHVVIPRSEQLPLGPIAGGGTSSPPPPEDTPWQGWNDDGPIHFVSFDEQATDMSSLCAIEAAAHSNPHKNIIIHSMNATQLSSLLDERWLKPEPTYSSKWLRSRVEVVSIVWEESFRATPFELWYSGRDWMNSTWPQQNLGNALRLATLYKQGGTYFDLDLVSVNPIPLGVERVIGMQDEHTLNNAALRFPKGDMFIWKAMQEFVADWNGHLWGWQGPVLLSRTLSAFCPSLRNKLGLAEFKAGVVPLLSEIDSIPLCHALSIFNPSRFYPIQFDSRQILDRPWWDECDTLDGIERESIGVHLWHKYSILEHVKHEEGTLSLREKVLQRSCPITNLFDL